MNTCMTMADLGIGPPLKEEKLDVFDGGEFFSAVGQLTAREAIKLRQNGAGQIVVEEYRDVPTPNAGMGQLTTTRLALMALGFGALGALGYHLFRSHR